MFPSDQVGQQFKDLKICVNLLYQYGVIPVTFRGAMVSVSSTYAS